MRIRYKGYKDCITEFTKVVYEEKSESLVFSVVTKYHTIVPEETVICRIVGVQKERADMLMAKICNSGYIDVSDTEVLEWYWDEH